MIIDGNKLFNITDDDGQDEAKRGGLLVAKPQLADPYFERSVVLLTGVDDSGAMGLVMNHPSGFMLGEVISGWAETASDIPIYVGGPVSLNTLFYVHTLPTDVIPDSTNIGRGLRLGGDFDAVKRYVTGGAPTAGIIKFLSGYSGWSAGQLSHEIEQQSWAVLKGSDPALLLADGRNGIWRKAVKAFGDRYRMWLTMPTNPNLN